jgi:hypothetical protein
MLASMENRLRRWLYRRDLAVWHAPEYRWPLSALEARTGAQPRRSDFTIWFLLERRALARANLRRPRRAEYEELARVHTPEAIAAVRADGFSGRVLVLDLDAHPPDGLAACLAGDPSCFIGSISGSDWGPLPGVDETVLPERAGDSAYLSALDALLARMPEGELAFVLVGGDVLATDPVGRVRAARDRGRAGALHPLARAAEPTRAFRAGAAPASGPGGAPRVDRLSERRTRKNTEQNPQTISRDTRSHRQVASRVEPAARGWGEASSKNRSAGSCLRSRRRARGFLHVRSRSPTCAPAGSARRKQEGARDYLTLGRMIPSESWDGWRTRSGRCAGWRDTE